MNNINILNTIINDCSLNTDQRATLDYVIEKLTPIKLIYKNGFANCKCGCEFESEGYQGEEFCTECGQKVWVGGYQGELIRDNIVQFR